MKTAKQLLFVVCLGGIAACAQPRQQDRAIGGPCEDCELLYGYGAKKLSPVDTLPDFTEPGPRLEISGTIFQRDGKTPAAGVILYIYHTDQQGFYAKRGREGKTRHGYIRGWIKTGADGKYRFCTLRPAPYPGAEDAAHIHPLIKEPGFEVYWIDDYVFDDDPLLTAEARRRLRNRGGSGILRLRQDKDGILHATRDIVLGLNVPD